ncbi:hypothetical protein GWK47_037935 [Chionoecetes opilio]|uniref:Nuclease HARBI1 n=1 Tax=Chionoecetes opilio TaxID=41210 RepID=A0A8J4YD25_CHIOP|nr:hypothetical protein GWK47_037935 [Chionoecetes opilio]
MCIINRRRRAKKRAWIRSWLARREKESVYHRLLKELSVEDHETMKNWIRLDKDQYHKLLQLVTPLIAKKDTRMRKAVTAGERLTLTLRYLATGESHASLGCQFRISHNLISSIIPSVCRAIYQVLKQQFLRFPNPNQSEPIIILHIFISTVTISFMQHTVTTSTITIIILYIFISTVTISFMQHTVTYS